MTRTKRRAAQGAAAFAVLGLLCVMAVVFINVRASVMARYLNFTEPSFAAVLERLEREGPSPALGADLASLPKKLGIVAFIVTVGTDNHPGHGEVLVGDRPEFAGRNSLDIVRELAGDRNKGTTTNRQIAGPNGKSYWLTAILTEEPPYYHEQAGWAGTVGLTAFAIAWLALVCWVLSDAQERGAGTAPAWGLLTLLTGPIGLGAYLVVRPTPEACPGCGKSSDPGGLFCPYCGHGLRPGCPDCRRPVNLDWAYCAACGQDLGDRD